MMKRFATVIAVAMCTASINVPAAAETLTNDTIIMLVKAGLDDSAIVAKINASDQQFALSIDQLIALKKAGVSGAVITAMVDRTAPKKAEATDRPQLSMDSPDPMTAHPSGVYLLNSWSETPRMARIDSTVTNQAKTGGLLGYALTGGLASLSVKASIQNETARTKALIKKPVFYFFFDEANPQYSASSSWLSGASSIVSSPSEFTLIHLAQKQGRRETRVGSMNIGGAKTGVMDKDRIAFAYEMVRSGVFKVTPERELSVGEYGFISSVAGSGQAGAMTARIFDFSIN
ncbi:MAG: hypothetical protein ABI395_01505 [Sphingobium sp.]